MELRSVRDVPWISFPSGLVEEGPKSLFDSEVSFDLELPATRLVEDRDGVAVDILREIFFALNWADVAATEDQLNQLLDAAYRFNFWQE
jgi:hypothetical protein